MPVQGCTCLLCAAGGDTVHAEAHRLLAEACRVVTMHKAERDAYYLKVKGSRGEVAAQQLVGLVNTVRRATKGREE